MLIHCVWHTWLFIWSEQFGLKKNNQEGRTHVGRAHVSRIMLACKAIYSDPHQTARTLGPSCREYLNFCVRGSSSRRQWVQKERNQPMFPSQKFLADTTGNSQSGCRHQLRHAIHGSKTHVLTSSRCVLQISNCQVPYFLLARLFFCYLFSFFFSNKNSTRL